MRAFGAHGSNWAAQHIGAAADRRALEHQSFKPPVDQRGKADERRVVGVVVDHHMHQSATAKRGDFCAAHEFFRDARVPDSRLMTGHDDGTVKRKPKFLAGNLSPGN